MTEEEELRLYDDLVQKCVNKFLRKVTPNVLREDLESAGRSGLLDGIRRSKTIPRNPGYLYARIWGSISDELRAEDWLSRRARKQVGNNPTIFWLEDITEHETSFSDPKDRTVIDRDLVEKLLAALSREDQRILRRIYFDNISGEELAKELNISQPRISQLKTRAIQRLKTVARNWELF